MLFFEAHHDVAAYVEELNEELHAKGKPGISKIQRRWISFCITGIIVTGTFLWSRLERACAGSWSARAMNFMFRCSNIPWQWLFSASVRLVLKRYKLTAGDLAIDDTARIRSKQMTKLWGVHKLKDKKTNGYVKGQELVILVLVTPKITLPVGFEFYRPDPTFRDWQKKDEKLRKLKVPRRERPIKPTRDPKFPTKQAICLSLVRGFRYLTASSVHVHSMLADAAYQSCYFLNECRKIFPKSRVISQLRSNQIVQNPQ